LTAPRRARRDDGGGGAGPLAGAATLRGGLLIGAAVLLGVVLLGKGFDTGFLPSTSDDPSDQVATGNDDDGDGGDDATTTTPTTSAITHTPADVRVQVLNGGAVTGSAGAASDELTAALYNVVEAQDASQPVTASTIFAAEGYESDAAAIAEALGITSEVQPMATPPPAPAPADLNVLIVIGPDFTAPS
jgi:hypothetical protein